MFVVIDPFTVHFTKLLTNSSQSSFEIPEVRYTLSNFITSCQSNRELQNKVVNFTLNFIGKLQSSLQVKFAPFGVVGFSW